MSDSKRYAFYALGEKGKSSAKSFLFSLKDHAGIGPVKMPKMSNKTGHAVIHNSSYGTLFGNGCDLLVASNANENTESHCNVGNVNQLPSNTNDRLFLTGSAWFTIAE